MKRLWNSRRRFETESRQVRERWREGGGVLGRSIGGKARERERQREGERVGKAIERKGRVGNEEVK